MKATKRLMTWLLVLAMVFTLLPMPAHAEEVPTETIPETAAETIPETVPVAEVETIPEAEPDAAPQTERFTAVIPYQVNPLYEGLYEPDPEDIPQFPEPEEYSTLAVTYETVEEAGKDVRTNMKNRTETYTVYVKSTSSDYNAVFAELMAVAVEHTGTGTEGDYLMWHLSGYGASLSYSYSGGYYNYTYNITTTYYTTAAQEKELTTAVNNLIKSLGVKNKSDYEKVCAVYDYMCANISYDYDNLNDTSYELKFSAYAALVNKTAVCQGYALLFYRLMLELGVDTRFIGGDGGGPHAWNIVQLGDYYYNVDATWDAGYTDYSYFLKSTWNFGNHYRDPEFDYWEFHMDHPMAAEDYVHGGTATLDPYINMGYCGADITNAAWAMMRDGTLVIEGEGAMYDYTTDTIPYWYYWIDHIEKVEIDEGITAVGDYCFYQAPALKEVVLPESLTEIGSYAFKECKQLVSVNFPSNLTYIDGDAFRNCISLTKIEFPSSLTKIGYRAFEYCAGLTEIVFNEGLTELDTGVFESCLALTTMELPDSLTTIGTDAFRNCDSLTEVTIPGNVVNVTGFQECDNLLTVYINGRGRIGGYAFYSCDKLENVVIGDKITGISGSAFQYCRGLKELTIPANVVSVNGFSSCSGLETLVLHNTGAIENYAFDGCTSLKSLTITNATSIGHMAFQSAAITSVEIPATVTKIDYGAFGGNRSLKEIYFLGDAPAIDSNTFYYVTATAYYPYGNGTWTADKFQNYGGTLTWMSYAPPCTEHTYEGVVTEPTCTEQGYTTYTCTNCGESYVGDYTDPVPHSYEGVVTAPTCQAQGYTTYTCAVCGESYVGDYTAPVDHSYVDGTCVWCGDEVYTTRWIAATTSLNGTIDLNIYVALSENLLDEEDAFVRFTHSGVTVDVPVSEGIYAVKNDIVCYRFSCEIFAKQVADTVTIQVMDENGAISDALEYSVMKYCVNQINKNADPELVSVCKALLNYATAAQTYFDYNTENLANASLSDADKVLPEVDASAYKFTVVGSEPGIKPRSATLMLEAEVAIRVYFFLEEGRDISDYTFTIDGKEATVQQNDKGYYIESDGIPAKELDDMHQFAVGGLTVNYGALSYVNSKASSTDVLEANLAKALYAYYAAAEALLG